MVKPIVLGARADMGALPALDAAGFSAAIPGLLHYEPGRFLEPVGWEEA